jgi:hypothetical protein
MQAIMSRENPEGTCPSIVVEDAVFKPMYSMYRNAPFPQRRKDWFLLSTDRRNAMKINAGSFLSLAHSFLEKETLISVQYGTGQFRTLLNAYSRF